MKQQETFKRACNRIFLGVFLGAAFLSTTPVHAQANRSCVAGNQCQNCIDDDGDGKADYDGNDTLGPSKSIVEPDPSCFSTSAREGGAKEEKDDVKSSIIPCTDKCTFTDVFRLLNNLLVFFIRDLLLPIFIIIIMYTGYKYIMAQGNPVKVSMVKKTFLNLILGLLLILCAWLIVSTLMRTLISPDFDSNSGLIFFDNSK
jgi:hypothetical protein